MMNKDFVPPENNSMEFLALIRLENKDGNCQIVGCYSQIGTNFKHCLTLECKSIFFYYGQPVYVTLITCELL